MWGITATLPPGVMSDPLYTVAKMRQKEADTEGPTLQADILRPTPSPRRFIVWARL